MVLRYIYTFFLGLLIAIFVGVGISVFYESPTQPTCYENINYGLVKEANEEIMAQEKACEKVIQTWEENEGQPYSRNVSIIAMIISVILVAVSFALYSKFNKVIADGVMLGGVFTLVYSMIRGFASTNTKYSFVVVTVALIVAVILGYTRIIEPHEKKTAATK